MPLPVTLELIALLARKWSLNNLLCSLDGIPMPVSSIITYQYYALVSEKEYKSSALKEVISQYYNNSYVNVVSSFIEEEGLSVDELKALIDQIQRGKNEK